MSTILEQYKSITQSDKERLAYELWERANRPNGNDLHFWIEAEAQLIALRREAGTGSLKPVRSRRRIEAIKGARRQASSKPH